MALHQHNVWLKLIYIIRVVQGHCNTLIPAKAPTLVSMEANFLSLGRLVPEWQLLPGIAEVAFQLWGLPE